MSEEPSLNAKSPGEAKIAGEPPRNQRPSRKNSRHEERSKPKSQSLILGPPRTHNGALGEADLHHHLIEVYRIDGLFPAGLRIR
jgi:hypothetical protein